MLRHGRSVCIALPQECALPVAPLRLTTSKTLQRHAVRVLVQAQPLLLQAAGRLRRRRHGCVGRTAGRTAGETFDKTCPRRCRVWKTTRSYARFAAFWLRSDRRRRPAVAQHDMYQRHARTLLRRMGRSAGRLAAGGGTAAGGSAADAGGGRPGAAGAGPPHRRRRRACPAHPGAAGVVATQELGMFTSCSGSSLAVRAFRQSLRQRAHFSTPLWTPQQQATTVYAPLMIHWCAGGGCVGEPGPAASGGGGGGGGAGRSGRRPPPPGAPGAGHRRCRGAKQIRGGFCAAGVAVSLSCGASACSQGVWVLCGDSVCQGASVLQSSSPSAAPSQIAGIVTVCATLHMQSQQRPPGAGWQYGRPDAAMHSQRQHWNCKSGQRGPPVL